MTQEEAQIIADIVATADRGCRYCVKDLCERLNETGIGFDFKMTGKKREVKARYQWSDDPEDISMETFPEIIAFKKENN